MNIANLLRTPILKNIFELLFERFPTRTNNITSNIESEEDISSKTKQNKKYSKTQLDKSNFFLMPFDDTVDHFVFLYFFNSCETAFALHNKT